MSALSIQPTFPIFTDIDGQPLEDGYIFIGAANLNPQTNPIIVYQNAALTTVAVQPIRTRGGYPVFSGTPGRLYVNSDYSIQVQNKNGSVVYSAPAPTERYNSADVSYQPPFANSVATTVESKLSQIISTQDFGAVGNATAISRALVASGGNPILLENGIYGGHLYDPLHPSSETRYIGGAVRASAGASFTASISGTTMTVTSVASGTIQKGQSVFATSIAANTYIVNYISGSGSTGTYEVSVSQTLGSRAMTTPATWSLIDDGGHDPLGLTAVYQTNPYTLRVEYNGDNTITGTILMTSDAELAAYGISCGASASPNYSDFVFAAPVIVDLQNSSTPSVAPWLQPYVTLQAAGTYSTVINHPPRAINVNPPGATLINRSSGSSRQLAITWGDTSVTVTSQGIMGALLTRTGSGVFSVSQLATAGTFTATWSGGVLTFTHPTVNSAATPTVTSFNSAYRAEVYSVTDTTVDIVFRNSSGVIVLTDDAEMKCWVTRNNAFFDSIMPTSLSARIDLGYLQIPISAVYVANPLNNFWITGAMIK
jgi:hypothetical protein